MDVSFDPSIMATRKMFKTSDEEVLILAHSWPMAELKAKALGLMVTEQVPEYAQWEEEMW